MPDKGQKRVGTLADMGGREGLSEWTLGEGWRAVVSSGGPVPCAVVTVSGPRSALLKVTGTGENVSSFFTLQLGHQQADLVGNVVRFLV